MLRIFYIELDILFCAYTNVKLNCLKKKWENAYFS